MIQFRLDELPSPQPKPPGRNPRYVTPPQRPRAPTAPFNLQAKIARNVRETERLDLLWRAGRGGKPHPYRNASDIL